MAQRLVKHRQDSVAQAAAKWELLRAGVLATGYLPAFVESCTSLVPWLLRRGILRGCDENGQVAPELVSNEKKTRH